MNNSQEIILAQISAIYDKPPFVKVKTGQMEMILKCIGLGKYYDEYAKYLEPYWYNRGFQNDIESYRIFVGLNSIFEDLLNAHKGDEIISLLTELGNHIQGNILCDGGEFVNDFNRLCQLYNLMGLQIVSTEIDEYSSRFEVKPYLNEGNQIVQSFGMEQWLEDKYQDTGLLLCYEVSWGVREYGAVPFYKGCSAATYESNFQEKIPCRAFQGIGCL